MRCRIGNGNLINIWTQPWLPDSNKSFISSSPPLGLENLHVHSIIDHEKNSWKMDMVEKIFNDVDVQVIQNIPLMNSQANDLLIWNQSASGNFTMRLAYHLMEKMICNSTLKVEGNWYLIRALRIPPKVKYFLWHTLRSGLPTRTRFQQKEVQHTSLSKYCGTKMENE